MAPKNAAGHKLHAITTPSIQVLPDLHDRGVFHEWRELAKYKGDWLELIKDHFSRDINGSRATIATENQTTQTTTNGQDLRFDKLTM